MAPSLEQLKSQYAELNSINEGLEKSVRYYESTTIKLVVAYMAIQTLILLSISRSNISCQHWWIPFCLSSLNAAIFAIPFQVSMMKWERTKYYFEMHFMELELIHYKMQVTSIQGTRDEKDDNNIDIHDHDQSSRQILKPDVVKLYQIKAFICLVTSALVAYTLVVLISCRSILCHIATSKVS